ncbi:MAG: hypothetical protein WDA00_05980 [Eubacteriales bacterium]
MGNQMKAHERFVAAAKGKSLDRLPLLEWASWWDLTLDNWRRTHPALRPLNVWELHAHFGLDRHLQCWFDPRSAETPRPRSHGAPIVRTLREYGEIRHTLYPEPCLSPEFIRTAKDFHRSGTGVVWYTIEGFFWFPRTLLGIEGHLYSFYDDPELYHTICADLLRWARRVVSYCGETLDFDFMTFAEDMSYNAGPMISKPCFDTFLAPYYRQLVPLIRQTGALTMVDSDGDITAAVDWFGEVGIEGMLPLERQAGADISRYQRGHPDMFFLGHFDKLVLDKGEAAIRAEFDRLLPGMVRGRFIPSVDHQTPPAVTYDDYLTYLRLFREYATLAAAIRARENLFL